MNNNCIFGQPQIKSATVHLKDGKLLQIEHNNRKSVLLNDKPINGFKLSQKQILAGGTLKF